MVGGKDGKYEGKKKRVKDDQPPNPEKSWGMYLPFLNAIKKMWSLDGL